MASVSSSKPSFKPGASTARKKFFEELLQKIPADKRKTFDSDPEFTHAPEGMTKEGDDPVVSTVPQIGGYMCVTQKTLSSINIGLGRNIPRWKPREDGKPVVVKWAALKTGYPSQGQAKYAAYSLAQAAYEWTKKKVGVTFEWVTKIEDAAFVLEYGGQKGTVLAEAFFPTQEPLSSLFVYKGAFTERTLPYVKNIFLHELGHVLGLRHEFALEEETEWWAARFGSVNPDSVMSYNFPPKIHDLDVVDTTKFYQYAEKKIGGKEIVDFEPDN
ncbi:hypothetical protein B0I37DRAFT_387046 [Chaetomium sp. MPI-CAGE-AT-0009]|nr:hypothetical protein B0I37DRAFT_387046 [Chaetomium sp. MPI-CAGE-AT-0009]